MSYTYAESIDCNNTAEYPIEHLFKCISILESIPECTKELAKLKKLADKYWNKISVKKNIKTYEGYILEQSGICYHKKASWKKIILSSYEHEYIELAPKKDPIYTACVKDHSVFWYIQLKAYQKKKPTFGKQYDKKPVCNIVKYNNMLKAMRLVTKEESEHISLNSGFNINKMQEDFFRLFNCNGSKQYYYNKDIRTINSYILTNEELKDLDEFIESCRGSDRYSFERTLSDYIDVLKKSFSKDRDLSSNMISITHYRLNLDESKGINEYQVYFDKVYNELLKIEDPAVIALLKEYNIVDENHEPIKATKEETVEDVVEIIVSTEEVSKEVDNILEVEFTAI
jgi:hypothetical protein